MLVGLLHRLLAEMLEMKAVSDEQLHFTDRETEDTSIRCGTEETQVSGISPSSFCSPDSPTHSAPSTLAFGPSLE